jgi:hypothetical protein
VGRWGTATYRQRRTDEDESHRGHRGDRGATRVRRRGPGRVVEHLRPGEPYAPYAPLRSIASAIPTQHLACGIGKRDGLRGHHDGCDLPGSLASVAAGRRRVQNRASE